LVEMPPTAPGDPAAPWLGAAPAALAAVPGPDRSVPSGAHVVLDGTRSTSPTGAITAWSWVQVAGTTVALTSADTHHPEFDAPTVADEPAQLAFELTVWDGTGASTTATQLVLVHEPYPPGPASGVELVRRAMREGTLDRDTAAQYLAFSAFGDPRLPPAYQGDVESPSGSWPLAVLREEYATLSPGTQSVVLPFLLPPGHPTRLANGLDRGTAALSARPSGAWPAAAAPPAHTQRGVESTHVVVWYWTDEANAAATADKLVDEIEATIWPKLAEVWGDHMPIVSDAGVGAAFRGTHGKLNVFLDPVAVDSALKSVYGYENAYGSPFHAGPSYVVLTSNLPWSQKGPPPGLIQCAAHEITHACQDSLDHSESYEQRRFLYEAVATWAMDDVYRDVNAEHGFAPAMMDFPLLPLDDEIGNHPYGAYLFFQWYTRGSGDRAFVRRAFENLVWENSAAAVDDAFPLYNGQKFGLDVRWGDFLEAQWNGDPAKYFQSGDGLTKQVKEQPVRTLTLGGGADVRAEMAANVAYLAGTYHHFTVDPGVRTIHFFDGFTYPLAEKAASDGTTLITVSGTPTADEIRTAATRVLVKRPSGWVSFGPMSASTGNLYFCQDDPADAVQEIIIAFGNARTKRGDLRSPKGVKPALWATNIGCYRWRGSVSAQSSPNPDGPVETLVVNNVVFGPWVTSGQRTGAGRFEVKSGSASWSIGGSDSSGCSYSGSGSFPVGPTPYGPGGMLTFAPEIVRGGVYRTYEADGSSGLYEVSYTVTCPSPDGSTVTTHTKAVDWLNTARQADPSWRPTVSASGNVASGTADDGSMVYTWSFTREAGP
jgi:hypothetical protein